MPGSASGFGPRFLNSPFRPASSFGFNSRDFFMSSTEPSLSPFSNLARPRSLGFRKVRIQLDGFIKQADGFRQFFLVDIKLP